MDVNGTKSILKNPVNLDDNNNTEVEKTGSFAGKKVTFKSLSLKDVLLKGLSKIKAFFQKPFENREIRAHNQALKSTRVISDLDHIVDCNRDDLACYDELDGILSKAGFDKSLLKDKSSEEITAILLNKKLINQEDVDYYKENGVDLEGSPYW